MDEVSTYLAKEIQTELQLPVYREEATSMGAAVCGGVGIGLYKDYSVMETMNPVENSVVPNKDLAETYARSFDVFNETYEALKPIYARMAQEKR